MSLEAMVHRRWSHCRPLIDLVPMSRLFTGLARGENGYPHVTLQRPGMPAVQSTSSGKRLAVETLAFRIWDNDLDRAQQVAAGIDQCFERADFGWSEPQVLDMRRTNSCAEETSPGLWLITLTYSVRTCSEVRRGAA